MCPALHSWCTNCQVRGHETILHSKGQKIWSASELRRDFKENAHRGFLTCPIYVHGPEFRFAYFRSGYFGGSRIYGAADAWEAGHEMPFTETERKAAADFRERAENNFWEAYGASGLGSGARKEK